MLNEGRRGWYSCFKALICGGKETFCVEKLLIWLLFGYGVDPSQALRWMTTDHPINESSSPSKQEENVLLFCYYQWFCSYNYNYL
ncbi:hypothetical protein ACET3Z_003997 [Daucus carota]